MWSVHTNRVLFTCKKQPSTGLPRLAVGLCPDEAIVNWKCRSKLHLIPLTYWTWQLSLPSLKCAPNTYISLQLGKIISHKAYFIIVVSVSCNLSNTVLKVTNGTVVGGQTVVSQIVPPPDRVVDWELWPAAAAWHHERGSSKKSVAWEQTLIPDSQFQVWFLPKAHGFLTIRKLKNRKSHPCKSGVRGRL